MDARNTKHEWEKYCTQMLAELAPILNKHGYELDPKQPHIMGERFLTRPIEGATKLVLLGRRTKDGLRVVIKASNDREGIKELEAERRARDLLEEIKFAYKTFFSPPEIAFFTRRETRGFGILVTEFIEQEKSFLERPIEDQFRLALGAFKAQEGLHATAYGHQSVLRAVGEMCGIDYVKKASEYARDLSALGIDSMLATAVELIRTHQETLDRYGGFLTHWDFIPQNFRIRDDKLYLIDHSSIRFGNKYEGWARFINFMVLYNPPLADALVEYVRLNRAPEESLALQLMRVYRLTELIRYYTGWLERTEDNLHELTRARIVFWTEVLRAVLDGKKVSSEAIEEYKKKRDELRSDDEKFRQKDLH